MLHESIEYYSQFYVNCL